MRVMRERGGSEGSKEAFEAEGSRKNVNTLALVVVEVRLREVKYKNPID
jgi:hypothetical protein